MTDANTIAALLARTPTQLFIDGQWTDPVKLARFPVTNPATGEILAEVADGRGPDAMRALDAACTAQKEWAGTSPQERADLLAKTFDLVREHTDDFATLMTLEMGKPLAQARGEVTYGAEYLRWFAGEATRLYGSYTSAPEGTLRMLTQRKPIGPCLLITPWNFPLAMATRKIAPALAGGNTVILKPAGLTPLTALFLVELFNKAGVPRGVINAVTTASSKEISGPLLTDPRLRKLSFTGSTAVGQTLLRQASQNVLRTSMELGGNAPFIVFDDADIFAAVDGAMKAKMRNIGEACTAANRFLIHDSIAEEFTDKLAKKIGALSLGNGLEDSTDIGPLITAQAVTHMEDIVADATSKGARVVVGGTKPEGPGNFFTPTLLTDVPVTARAFTEEIFGPIAPIFTFHDEEEVIELANRTEYGLAAYVFTSDQARMLRMTEELEFGLIGANCGVMSNAAAPFGGVKHSGLGKEGGAEGIEEYTTLQYIGIPNPF